MVSDATTFTPASDKPELRRKERRFFEKRTCFSVDAAIFAVIVNDNIMGKVYQAIDKRIQKWIAAQKVFFVATAPLSGDSHINCSPKDGYSIRVVDERTLVYLDLIGSGVETIAHLRENGRIIIMMCAFEGAPMIMRFHGRAEVIEQGHRDFEGFKSLFTSEVGIRSFILIHLDRISDSCGFGVPVMEFKNHRKQLRTFNERNGEEKLADYKMKHNSLSIDGIEGITTR